MSDGATNLESPGSSTECDLPESTITQGDPIIDDSNQYEEFYLDDELLQPGESFPASEKSKEISAFKHAFGEILSCLKQKEINWESVECVGRLSDEKKIRTTVLIGLSYGPEDEEQQTLKRDLEAAMGSVISEPLLPIEFVKGGFVEESHFGFKEVQHSLVCGSSWGISGRPSSGTIGGFITIKGDPDADAVYAVTCHHVISGESIEWPDDEDYTKRLGTDMHLLEDFRELGGDRLLNGFCGRTIQALVELRKRLRPPFREVTGTDQDAQNEYLRQLDGQFSHLLMENSENSRTEKIVGSVLSGRQSNSNPYDERHHVLEYLHQRALRPEQFLQYGERDENPLVVFVSHVLENIKDPDGAAVLHRLLRLRRICRKLNLELLAEHPSGRDRRQLCVRLASERDESRTYSMSASQTMGRVHQESQEQHADVKRLERAHHAAANHDRSSDRFIGVVWASRRSTHYIEPRNDSEDRVDRIREDWALIKLFPEVRDGLQNAFDKNILRPNQPSDRFTDPDHRWTLERCRVSKRGRTTDYTIGRVNSAPVAGRVTETDTPTLEYAIVPTGTNGLFSQRGDSGSWVMDKHGKLIGMVWGKNTASKTTLFTPGQYLFRRIGEAFEEAMRRRGIELEEIPAAQRVQVFPRIQD